MEARIKLSAQINSLLALTKQTYSSKIFSSEKLNYHCNNFFVLKLLYLLTLLILNLLNFLRRILNLIVTSQQIAVVSLQSFTFAVGMATFILLSQTHESKTNDVTTSRNKSDHGNQEHQDDNNPPLIGEQIWIPFLVGCF